MEVVLAQMGLAAGELGGELAELVAVVELVVVGALVRGDGGDVCLEMFGTWQRFWYCYCRELKREVLVLSSGLHSHRRQQRPLGSSAQHRPWLADSMSKRSTGSHRDSTAHRVSLLARSGSLTAKPVYASP
jgi:hypothetical protein